MANGRDKRAREAVPNEVENDALANLSENALSGDIMSLVATKLSPKQRKTAAVCKAFRVGFYSSDKAQFNKHFPHLTKKYEQKGVVDWRIAFEKEGVVTWHMAFIDAMQEQHNNDRRKQLLFYHTKESNLADLQRLNVTYSELFSQDKSNDALVLLARIYSSQATCDYFYQIVAAHYQAYQAIGIEIDTSEHSMLHWAVICTQPLAAVKQLITEAHCNVNQRNTLGLTPLNMSIHKNTLAYTQLLLEHGADKENKDTEGQTVLAYAIKEDAPRTVRYLLDNKTDIHATCDADGNVALTYAALDNKIECLRVLLDPKYKGNINTQADSQTALFIASRYGHEACVELLLKHGADPFILTDQGKSPVYIAARAGHINVLRLLMTHCYQQANQLANLCAHAGDSPLLIAADHGHEDCMTLLIACGAKINLMLPGHQKTALMIVADDHENDALARFIRFGADINFAREGDEATALHLATLSDNLAGIKILLTAGADYLLPMLVSQDDVIEYYETNFPDQLPALRERLKVFSDNKTHWAAEELAWLLDENEIYQTLRNHRKQATLPGISLKR